LALAVGLVVAEGSGIAALSGIGALTCVVRYTIGREIGFLLGDALAVVGVLNIALVARHAVIGGLAVAAVLADEIRVANRGFRWVNRRVGHRLQRRICYRSSRWRTGRNSSRRACPRERWQCTGTKGGISRWTSGYGHGCRGKSSRIAATYDLRDTLTVVGILHDTCAAYTASVETAVAHSATLAVGSNAISLCLWYTLTVVLILNFAIISRHAIAVRKTIAAPLANQGVGERHQGTECNEAVDQDELTHVLKL
jgi:hypothetical protein